MTYSKMQVLNVAGKEYAYFVVWTLSHLPLLQRLILSFERSCRAEKNDIKTINLH